MIKNGQNVSGAYNDHQYNNMVEHFGAQQNQIKMGNNFGRNTFYVSDY